MQTTVLNWALIFLFGLDVDFFCGEQNYTIQFIVQIIPGGARKRKIMM